MLKSTFYYSKVLLKNPLFLFLIPFLIVMLFFTKEAFSTSIFDFVKHFYYGFIIVNLFFLITTTTTTNKDFEIHNYLERNPLKKQYTILLASFWINIVLLFIPILFIVCFQSNDSNFYIMMRGILHFSVLWILTNLLSATMGTTIGSILKNIWALPIAIVSYSIFIWRSMSDENNAIQKMFNIYDDNIRIVSNNILGVIFNVPYVLDKLFIVLLIFLFISFVGFYRQTKKRFLYLAIGLGCIGIIGLNANYLKTSEQIFTSQYPDVKAQSYKIISYDMDIDFSKNFKNQATLHLKIENNIDHIVLLLDQVFHIKKITINHLPVSYSFTNHKLILHTFQKKGDEVKIDILYDGHLFMNNDVGAPTFYVTKQAINLPGNIFYWYPTVPTIGKSQFTIKTKSSIPLYTNLQQKTSSLYEGTTNSISFVAGEYKKINHNGKAYIIPKVTDFHRFTENLDDMLQSLSKKEYPKEELANIKAENYQKVIVGFWPGYERYVFLNNDTLFVNGLNF